MTPLQKRIHEEALICSRNFKRAEWALLATLQDVMREKVHREAGCRSPYEYARDILQLPDSLAYTFTNVAAKAAQIPELAEVLRAQKISATKAARLTSVLTTANAAELVAFALDATNREIDRKRAELNPLKKRRAFKKQMNQNELRFSCDLSNETLELLERAKELQSKQAPKSEDQILNRVLSEWLERHDPVRKAARGVKKTPSPQPEKSARTPLTAAERHAVFHRDGGKCVFINENGTRCDHTKWVEVHHIVEVAKGGTNHPSNLRTLCSFHHDLIHQLSFPLEYQFNWIREPRLEYRH